MPRDPITDFLTDRLRVVVSLVVPATAIGKDDHYDTWVSALSGKAEQPRVETLPSPEPIDGDAQLFVQFYLRMLRLFCQMGRLPVFDVPKVASLSRDTDIRRKYVLEIELPLVSLVSESTYQIAIEASLGLCDWMARSRPTPVNASRVFGAITEKLIEPLRKRVPGGESTIPVLRVAHSLGIPFAHLGKGVYQLGWGSKARRLDRSSTGLDSAMGAKLAQSKLVTASILRVAGLPAPVHAVANNEAQALAAADRLGFPVVIKPCDRDRGEGVSVDVADGEAIRSAYAIAQRLTESGQVLVERQVEGVCHRLFIADGRLLYAVKRLPMSVRGNGRDTIARLVSDEVLAQARSAPWKRSRIRPIDEPALRALAEAGFSPTSLLAKGALAPLRRIESTADGGVDEEVTAIVHPDNVSAAITASALLGLHLAGVDIISADISRPWYENGAIINEVNFSPLFGGGEISRSAIPRFLANFIDGDGRVPIESFDSEDAAVARQAHYRSEGARCYFTSSATTIDAAGNVLAMPFKDVRRRVKALVCRPDVDAITVCLPGAEALVGDHASS